MMWSRVIDRLCFLAAAALAVAGIAAIACGAPPTEHVPLPDDAPRIVLETSLGEITIGLYAELAPISVANFLEYVDAGFYDGVIFHRVLPGFAVQTGGFLPGMIAKQTGPTIVSESDNGLKNLRGTVAMAREPGKDSATSQFFFNQVDMPRFDYRPPIEYGYAVFGRVLTGMDVVDRIAEIDVHDVDVDDGTVHQGVPDEDVILVRARRAH
jgi:peptidyl-prolyl cis-trans isomerase A (cyclophilin A)